MSPELAAGIRRVKGVKQLGCRAGNWLNREQARLLLEEASGGGLRSIRDVAMLSILLGCGLRRAELSGQRREDIQVRQGHWAIVDLVGKGNHVRTVPDYGPAIQRFLTFFAEEGKKGLTPDKIGRIVHHALTARKPKVRYAIVPQRFKNWTLPRWLPKRVLDRLLGKQIGLLRKH